MKKLQRFCGVLSLALVLAISALAGDIQTGIAPPPPQSLVAGTTETDTGATSVSPAVVNDSTPVDPVRELALVLLESVLLIF